MQTQPAYLTLGALAKQFGLPVWKVRRLWERNFLPAAARIGQYRVVPTSQLPVVERALKAAGYLREQEAVGASRSVTPKAVHPSR